MNTTTTNKDFSALAKKILAGVIALVVGLALSTSAQAATPSEAYAASNTPAKVKTVKVSKKTTSTAKVTWSKAKKAKKYQVAYKKASAKKWSYKTVKANKKTLTIKKLSSNTKYKVKVRAINGKAKGKWSATKSFTTKKGSHTHDWKLTNHKNAKYKTVTVTDKEHVWEYEKVGYTISGYYFISQYENLHTNQWGRLTGTRVDDTETPFKIGYCFDKKYDYLFDDCDVLTHDGDTITNTATGKVYAAKDDLAMYAELYYEQTYKDALGYGALISYGGSDPVKILHNEPAITHEEKVLVSKAEDTYKCSGCGKTKTVAE